jgi:hypothetical protein
MHEDLLTVCPECEGTLAQDLCGVHLGIKLYNTVGSVAEKNTKELGHYGREDKELQLQKEQEQFNVRKREVLAQHGIHTPEVKSNSKIKIKEPPKSVLKKIAKNDKKGIKDYVMKGKT